VRPRGIAVRTGISAIPLFGGRAGHQRDDGLGLAQVENFVAHAGRPTSWFIYGVPRNLLVAGSTMPLNVVQPIAIAALGAVPPGRPAEQRHSSSEFEICILTSLYIVHILSQ
jgi:hypothetical protein